VPRHLTAFLSYGAAEDLPGYPVVLMHGAAPATSWPRWTAGSPAR